MKAGGKKKSQRFIWNRQEDDRLENITAKDWRNLMSMAY